MSPKTKKLLGEFAGVTNWNDVVFQGDPEKFWDFVIFAYKNGDRDISLDEFLDVINANINRAIPEEEMDFSDKKKELASKMFMFNKYEDGIKLLLKFEGK